MVRELQPIDVTDVPELRKLIAEVRASNAPRVLPTDGEDAAILMPMRSTARRPERGQTAADYQAVLATAGGWRDPVDTERLKADIAASRSISSRPPVEL